MNDTHKTQSAEELRKQKVEAYAASLENPNVKLEAKNLKVADDDWRPEYIRLLHWHDDDIAIRLAPAPATSIDWYNPDYVTQAQLQPEYGYRFACENETITDWQYWNNNAWHNSWEGPTSAVTVATGKTECTRRVKAALPAKYAHLEEAKAFAARSAFAAYKLNEGERLAWRGQKWESEIGASFLYFNPRHEDARVHRTNNGRAPGEWDGYYAEIIRDETAEDVAKRAKKELEPMKMEGCGPLEYLGPKYDTWEEQYRYARWHPKDKSGWNLIPAEDRTFVDHPGDFHYARARKLEPELVPFTMETWPVGKHWIRDKVGRTYETSHYSERGVYIQDFSYFDWSFLFSNYQLSTDAGQTWRKCGREVK
jgi:hypothetical protein